LRRISSQTVCNRLRQHGIRPRRPYFGAALTPLHRRERVHWCNRLRDWTFRNWRRIWFSDESHFLLQKRDSWIRVYRYRYERFFSSCVQEVDSFGGGSVMMWAAISNDRKTDLVHVPGNLTAVRYINEILQPHLMHVIDQQRELLQQDNARPHTARVAMDNINVLPWPSKSPDFNPIEHLWDQLDKRVRQRQPPPQTLDQLRQMLQHKWRTIPRNNVRNLIKSMPRRCRVVLAARGGHTRY
jgi:transposase